ncbi:helix-turn-helix transcriptional regulator [Acinetobacter sp. ACIN00229]|uniref:TetR/AcrR family transcriptional regulator n=1 Tax=Acinetobacter sp. ACIN00229 TaxID=2792607 RepID=UPI0018E03019|nr:helix-turn-helix transcriptional regulator [Acinetobacter sp. ACIN00229]
MKKSNPKEQAIRSTAIRLFNQESFTAVGMDRIIAESGVSKMTVYKYFSSKENLIVECL